MTFDEWTNSQYNPGLVLGEIGSDGEYGCLLCNNMYHAFEPDTGVGDAYSWFPLVKDGEYGHSQCNCYNIITFGIGNNKYTFKAGMTWDEWVNSEYNTDNYMITTDGYVTASNGQNIIINPNSIIKLTATEKIIPYYYYYYAEWDEL